MKKQTALVLIVSCFFGTTIAGCSAPPEEAKTDNSEICNGEDDNNNGLIDEEVEKTCYYNGSPGDLTYTECKKTGNCLEECPKTPHPDYQCRLVDVCQESNGKNPDCH